MRSLLDQTLVVLAAKGYDSLRVDEVARRAGVGKGTVYLHFNSKPELIDAALADAGHELVRRVTEAIVPIQDSRECVLVAARTIAKSLLERPDWAVLTETRSIRGAMEEGPPPCEPIRAYLESLILDAKRAGTFADGEEMTAEAILGLLSRPVWRELVAEEGFEEAVRRSGLDVFVAGAT